MRLPTLALATLVPFAASAEPMTLRVMSFNIWYGGIQSSFEQTVAAIRAADADIVGIQEPDGNTLRIAAAAGYPYVDTRRHIISRFPLFDSGLGERTETGQAVYSMAALDSNAPQVWAMVEPGEVVALGNLHLSSDPFGPDLAKQGASIEEILQGEEDTRVYEINTLLQALAPVVASGAPVIITGDFNSPGAGDWTEAVVGTRDYITFPVRWPATGAMEDAGFADVFRTINPDPVARPGLTYTPGSPYPKRNPDETEERIDYIFSANATPTGAWMMGEEGNPDVDITFMPWPSDHRAVIAEISVEPVQAPALIAVEPRLVREGGTFDVRTNLPGDADWSVAIVTREGDIVADRITGVAGIEWWWRNAITLGTLGLAAGPYDAVLLDSDGVEQARTRFSVIAPDGRPEVSVADAELAVGEPLTVSWSGAPGMRYDWLGIYAAGDSDVYNYLGFAYIGGTLDGTMELTPDLYYTELEPGDYEIRLFMDDSYIALASAPFTVTAP